ncbi:MAG: RNA polymerase sigma factor [Pirellulales bacterium]|nr:RNA polymerase sigma factor [Pirellulales bacterium]
MAQDAQVAAHAPGPLCPALVSLHHRTQRRPQPASHPWFENEAHPENIPDHRNDDVGVALENAEQVHHALAQLSLPQREALTLYFLQDLSLEEMADVLAVPLGTVKSRLHYAKLALRNILSPGDDRGR